MHAERAFVVCVYFVLAAHGDTSPGNRCTKGLPGTFTIQLQCSVGEWIHVEQEAYGDGDAVTCRLKKAESCSKVLNSNKNGLVVNCNGKQSCHEAVTATSQTNCNFTDAAAEVHYSCIKGSMDMCSSVNKTVNGSVYLHSPGFPDSDPVNSSCVVRITGDNIQVTLVEQRMKTGLLNISGDGKQLWTSVNVNQYNRVFPGTAAEVVIVYDNHDQNVSNVWIRVAASGQMNITSNGLMSDASTTPVPMSPHHPSISQDTTSETTATTGSAPSTTMDKSTTEAKTVNRTTKENMTSTASFITDNKDTTLSTTTSTAASDGSDPETVVWIASAASGCFILILIVVIAVVLCRCHRVKNSGSPVAPGSESFERSFELTHSQNETSNMHFVLDPELVAGSGERILHTESRHKTENYKTPVQDQYSDVLPRSSRVNMYDNSTFTVTTSTADIGAPQLLKDTVASTAYNDHRAICDMTENDIYDGEVASKDVTVDGMVDNGHNGKFEYAREDGYVQGESDVSPSNTKPIRKEKADMIENDVYDGGPPPHNDPVGSMDDNENHDSRRISTEKSHMTEHDLYDGGLDTGDDTGGGMVDNELYDKFGHDRERDSIQDESDDSPSNVFDKSVQDDEDNVMVSNGLYHSFK
ncbi:uncharacterized protein LOC124137135 isoform X1 [Haliotis rufescens]|uniref:uncharacterized protein LOC124137135 isoform X1 n=1 Tax=Haliotis rufescens TaxID=6454 RepID=UPI00201EF78A|nr:uncharacterized protein LOC124137135 isoform X1 [Haliotis rufescens]